MQSGRRRREAGRTGWRQAAGGGPDGPGARKGLRRRRMGGEPEERGERDSDRREAEKKEDKRNLKKLGSMD